jgi:Flp pilus assembly protein TadG
MSQPAPIQEPREAPSRAFVARLARSDAGTSAIEFAIVFPLFFLIFYAIVTFSLIFVAQQTLTLAAEEGARAALRYVTGPTTVAAALDARASASCTAATGVNTWISKGAACTATHTACSYDATMQCVAVVLTYDYSTYPLVPTLPLLSIALPATLTANATVQLNPNTVL